MSLDSWVTVLNAMPMATLSVELTLGCTGAREPGQAGQAVTHAAAITDLVTGTNTGKSDGGKTCAKAFVHCGILKPVKATGRPKAGKDYAG